MPTTPSQLVFTEEVQTATVGDQVPDPPDGSLTLFPNHDGDWYAKTSGGTVFRVGGQTSAVTMGGDISGTSTDATVAKTPSGSLVAGTHVTITTTSGKAKITGSGGGTGTVTTVASTTTGRLSVTTGTTTAKLTVHRAPPTGTAGGDLSGTYPTPDVAKVPSGALVAGTHVTVATTAGKAKVSATTHPTGSAGGDLTGSYPTPDVAKVPSGALVAGTRVTIATTSGKAKIIASVQTTSKVTMGGDVTGTSTASVVTKAPSASLVAGTDITITTTSGKAKISASGGGSGTVTTVSSPDSSVHITTGTTTPKLEVRLAKKAVTQSTTPTAGQLLYYTGTAGKWIAHTSSGSGTVTTVSSPTGEISVSTGTTTPKLEIAKTPSASLVAGTNISLITTSKKAKIRALDSGLGGSFRPTWWYGWSTGGTITPTKGKLYFTPFNWAWTTFPAKTIGVRVRTGKTSSLVRLGIYNDGGANKPTSKVLDAGTVATTTSTHTTTITISQTLPAGNYWLCCVAQTTGTAAELGRAGPTFPSESGMSALGYGTATFTGTSTSAAQRFWVSTGTTHTGALPTTAPALTAKDAGTGGICIRLQAS